jgi:hypothetical protein
MGQIFSLGVQLETESFRKPGQRRYRSRPSGKLVQNKSVLRDEGWITPGVEKGGFEF